MKLRTISVALLVALSGAGANAAVKIRYVKGQPTYVSTLPGSVVELAAPEQTRDRRVGLGVAVFNLGQQARNIGYENITVRTTAGALVPLITYEQLEHQARVRAGWATFFAALGSGLNSYAASQEGYGRVGRYTYVSPIARQYALDRADAQNAALFSSVSQALDSTLATLSAQVLRTTTVDPQTPGGGLVEFDLPKGLALRDLVISVSFGGETHEIRMDPSVQTETATATDLQPPAAPIAPPASYAAAPVAPPVMPPVAEQPAVPPQMPVAAELVPPPVVTQVAQRAPTAIAPAVPASESRRASKSTCIRVLTDPGQGNC